jgi:hypothetical protein
MKISKDGDYRLSKLYPDFLSRAISIAYTSGGGTAKLFYYNELGTKVYIIDTLLTPNSEDIISHGINMDLWIEVAGVTALAPLCLKVRGM